jgi:hypothetical protein
MTQDENLLPNSILKSSVHEQQVGQLIDTYTALDVHRSNLDITPGEDLQQSLAKFVQSYLKRVQSHGDLEDILKEALIERLAEADFEQIEKLLNTVMRNSSNTTEKIMAPFIQKEGGDVNNTFLFNNDKTSASSSVEDKMSRDSSMTPETMKGLYELAQLMEAVAQKPKPAI